MRPRIMILISQRTCALVAAVVAAGIILYLLSTYAVTVIAPVRDIVSGRTVAIDAGHGGPDSGARGKSGIREKHINLHIALELRALLGRAAVYTVMTREADHDLIDDGEDITGSRKRAELERRAMLVNARSPDVFVTIHSNSFPESQWSGAQVFYNPVSDEGRALAVHIQAQLVQRLGPNTRKARPADIYLLRRVKAPSALVEVGFLSNPREERLLSDPAYRVRVAEAVYHGIIDYLVDAAGREQHQPTDSDGSDWGAVRKVATAQLSPDSAVLYFGGPTNFDDSLMPEVREVPGLAAMGPADALTAVMHSLVAGPGKDSILQPTIPRGTVLRWVRLSGDVASVNLSAEFVSNHWGGSRAEEMTVYSIVNTLTEFAYVKRVILLVEGKPIQSIAGHIDIEEPLVRNLSIVHFRS
ncbi:MAG TPA: N-acetylmuramoyl-L-alanine amidase [Bacillota bacterium]|nr:N-acetylmuramoyl-L-alanine amidase [Bacillota bacterium]HOI36586.1 N-acetylmuramoyl-L-alanine amidase [Bacillota bacterium]